MIKNKIRDVPDEMCLMCYCEVDGECFARKAPRELERYCKTEGNEDGTLHTGFVSRASRGD